MNHAPIDPTPTSLRQLVAPYARADARRAIWQLANTLIPYGILWYLMWRSLSVSYWITLILAVPAAGLLMRIFISSRYRRNALPDGAFDPWTCWWQITQDRP